MENRTLINSSAAERTKELLESDIKNLEIVEEYHLKKLKVVQKELEESRKAYKEIQLVVEKETINL
ncbi:hypothetical protein QTG56_24690 (plasmid) [Rossellomorea sp. AcN35-11]|nr:hypothetical protein [Rossellomorea aquimaris]WJV31834.1 hypothetical protein QTG56_24690 [Rossellomorea sp. AcN35-11]